MRESIKITNDNTTADTEKVNPHPAGNRAQAGRAAVHEVKGLGLNSQSGSD